MKQDPGYPLPSGELGDDDLVCQLVYLPDRPEYWQAFLGALHYMTTWRAWERDVDKRGKDAAANWRAAFELTIGCWRMTCLEQLQDDVAAILAIMEMPQSCCEEQDVSGGDRYTDRVTDGVGDVPQNVIDAGYADDAADWAGFDDYKCMIVHVTVNQMAARLNELAPLVEVGGAIFGGLAAIAAIITVIFSGGAAAIVFGIFASVGVVSSLYDSLFEGSLLELLADKVDTNHDELACAMYESDGDEGALVALNDKIDELFTAPEALILKNLNNGPTLKALYSGRYDQQDIAAELEAAGYELDDFDCTCYFPVGEYLYTVTWDDDSDWENWQHASGDSLSDGNPDYGPKLRYGVPVGYAYLIASYLATAFGLPQDANRKFYIHRITVDWYADAIQNGDLKVGARTNQTGAPWIYTTFPNVKTWTNVSKEWDAPGRPMDNGGGFRIEAPGSVGGYSHIDNVTIDFDTWIE